MNIEESWTLKGPNNLSEELFYTKSEMTIQRNFVSVYVNILTGILLTALSLFFIAGYIHQGDDYRIILFLIQFALSIIVLIMGFKTFFKSRKMNKRTFTYSELSEVKTEIRNTMVGIDFWFKDGSRDRISVVKTGYYSLFIEILKSNSIEVIENNIR